MQRSLVLVFLLSGIFFATIYNSVNFKDLALTGGAFKQKLLFLPNADTNPKEEYELSEPVLFRYLIDEETMEEQRNNIYMTEMLKAINVTDKLSQITEFETHQSSMGSVTDGSKAFHVFIVFKTTSKKDGDYWWSLEKNLKYIVLQRSRSKTVVKDKLKGKERKRVKPIKENLKGKGSIRNLFAILWAHQIIEEKYHIMNSNCQSLVTLVGKQITEIGYDYRGFFNVSPHENDRDTEMLDLINLLTNALDNQHPLFSLIFHENTKLFDIVMKSGKYDIDDPIILDESTPLHLAIILAKTKMVQHLLDKWKADPTKSEKMAGNALHIAIKFAKDNMDIIDLLLAHEKVDINEREENGSTALHFAINSCNTIAVKHLLDKGANPNICDKNGQSPLHFAAFIGMDTEIIDLILKAKNNKGIDDVDDEYGYTALHVAAMSSNEITAEYLIKNGADVNYRDKFGRTQLHLAAVMAKDMKIIDLFLKNIKKEDVDQYNKDDEILTWAKKNKNGLGVEITDRLKKKGIFGKRKDPVLSADKSNITSTSNEKTENSNQSIDGEKIFQTLPEKLQDILRTSVSDEEMFKLLLNKAILDSDVGKVRFLIETGVDISTMTWEGGINALHAASKLAKTTDLIDVILENGQFDINGGDNKGGTPLHYAITGDQPTINVRHLIEKGADPTVRDNDGITPLHVAAAFTEHLDIFQLLLANEKVNIDEMNEKEYTPLLFAIIKSNVITVRYLIIKGANINIADEDGWTPLHMAVLYAKEMDIVELLLNHKDVDVNRLNKNGISLLDCAKNNNNGLGETIANRLKGKGAVEIKNKKTIDWKEEFKKFKKLQDDWGREVLERSKVESFLTDDKVTNEIKIKKMLPKVLGSAIANSDVEKVLDLIEKGIDINKVTLEEENGLNALHKASYHAKTTELIDVILENGKFDINGGDNKGRTSLHYAILGDNPTINVRHLIEEKGADPNIANADGRTALLYAIGINNVNVARHLLKNGADPTKRDNNGNTPLKLAAVTASLTEDTNMLDLLLANKNVNIDETDEDGWSALHYAITLSKVTTVRYLIKKGANPNIPDENGDTPLHFAAKHANDMDIVELLLNHKDVDVDYLNNKWENALHYAKDNLHGLGERIADRLKKKGAIEMKIKHETTIRDKQIV